jgi:DNA-binding PadR family transcriptional regulator
MDALDEIQSQLPLTEATYFILLSLAPAPRHGYAIMKDVSELSRERVALSTGTLYSALKRMLEIGWICRSDPNEEADHNGRQRKSYCLTNLGELILQAELQRLQGLVKAAQLRPIGGAS